MFYHKFWLHGTSDDLWPTNVTAAHIGDLSLSVAQGNNSCSLPASIFNNRCISTGYPKLFSHFNSVPQFFQWDWTLSMHEPTFSRVLGGTEAAASTNPETWAYAPHAATAFRQSGFWWDPLWFGKSHRYGGRASTVASQMAAVRTVCLQQDVRTNTTSLLFPYMREFEFYTWDFATSAEWSKSISVSTSMWSNDNNSFIDAGRVRTQWIPYSTQGITAGLVVMEAMTNTSVETRSVLACAVDARWAKASSQQVDGPLQAAVGAVALHQRQFKPIDGYELNRGEVRSHGFLPTDSSSWRSIAADMDWLQALTPSVPFFSPTLNVTAPASTLANIFMSTNHTSIAKQANTTQYRQNTPFNFWETVISTIVADGLSRIGYARQLGDGTFYAEGVTGTCNGPLNVCPSPPSPEDFTMMQIKGDYLDSEFAPNTNTLNSIQPLVN